MLTREDVERIVENVLKNLAIDVQDSFDPDYRKIILLYNGTEITSTTFSVKDSIRFPDF